MKKLVSSGLLLLCTFLCAAQFKVKGKVEGQFGKAIPGASVSIETATAKLLATTSDNEGNFFFSELKNAVYLLKVSALGFQPQQLRVNLEKDTSLIIRLENQIRQLETVAVQSKKSLIETRTDRRIFNAEGSAAATGTDVLEMLAKIPGIQVKNGVVSLSGKGAAGLMIDGRQLLLSGVDLTEYLKSLSAESVAKVEMISNPSASFDAQGSSGMVNIILKKKTDEGLKSTINSTLSKATYLTVGSGANMNYKRGRASFNAGLNFRTGSLVPISESTVYYAASNWNTRDRDRNYRKVPSGLADFTYDISARDVVSASFSTGLTRFHSTEVIRSRSLLSSGATDAVINSDAQANIRSNYYAAGMLFRHKFSETGSQISFNADYFGFKDNRKRNFDNAVIDPNGSEVPLGYAQFLSGSGQQINLYTLKADVEHVVKRFKLSYGGKLSLIRNTSDISFLTLLKGDFSPEPDQNNGFSYKENTSALYMSANTTFAKWDLQMGLRAEHTANEGISGGVANVKDYIQVFPTLFLNRSTWKDSKLSFSYGRRIERPAYRKLNPFKWYTNQFSFTEGNPFLLPFYTNNLELSHNFKGIWNFGLSISSASRAYGDVNFTEQGSLLQVTRPVNFVDRNLYTLSSSISLKPSSWIESINQVDVFYTHSTSALQQVPNRSGSGAYLSSTNQFNLNTKKTWLVDLSVDYYSPTNTVLGKTKARGGTDLGIRTFFANKKMQVALLGADIFKTRIERREVVVNGILQRYYNYNDTQQIRLNLRYSFGNQKVKVTERKVGNDEERKRSN